jgi:hypothetical protein
MNLSSGRGLGQPWLRGAAALATMVCLALDTAGLNLDQRSPQYHAAQQACQRLATHAKG